MENINHQKRKLGFWENICRFGHNYYSGTGNVLVYAEIVGHINSEDFLKALLTQYYRHPLLRATIVEERYVAYFEFNDDFSRIPVNITTTSSETRISKAEDLIKEKFDEEKYLWRVVLEISECKTKNFLYIIFHHAIADGLSATYFVNDLLEIIAKHDFKKQKLELLPDIESQFTEKTSWDNFLREKNFLNQQPVDLFPYEKLAKPSKRITRCIVKELKGEIFKKLINFTKEKKLTIQSILNASLLLAIKSLFPEIHHTRLHTPVNLRNFCTPTINIKHLGCYISMVTTSHNLSESDNFLEIAHAYEKSLKKNLKKVGIAPSDFYIGDFDIETLAKLFEMPGSTKRDYFSGGFGVSNLGYLNFPTQHADLELKNIFFMTHRAMGDYVLFLNVLSFNEQMNIVFCFAEPLISQETAFRIIDKFMEYLPV